MNYKICEDEKYETKCLNLTAQRPREFWCKCFPRYCDGDEDLPKIPNQALLKELAFLPYEEYKKYLQTFSELVKFCQFIMGFEGEMFMNCNLTNIQNIRCPTDNNYNLNGCYTVHSQLGLPNADPAKVYSSGFNIVLIDPMTREYGPHLKRESVDVAFHHSKAIISPYEYGYTMRAATKNIFHLKKTVKKLLPPPYETNCFDYLAVWKARGGWGPTTERECIDECKKNESIKFAGCVSDMFLSPGNELRCERSHWEITKFVMECAEKNCKPACLEESYQAVQSTAEYDDSPDCFALWRNERPAQKIILSINYDGMETTTYIYSPKFQNIETFSYLGGYVGMWLGISLVAVFDFLETVVVMMKYPFRKYMSYKNKQQRVDQIRRMHRDM